MFIYDICYDIIYDICSFAAADPAPAQRADDRDADLDRPMDADEVRDYADQDPPSDMDMEEDDEILATLLKHIPSCMNASCGHLAAFSGSVNSTVEGPRHAAIPSI